MILLMWIGFLVIYAVAFRYTWVATRRIRYTWEIQAEVISVISRIDQCLDSGNYDRSEIVRWSDHLKAISGLNPSTMKASEYRKLIENSKLRQYELFRDSVSGGIDDESQPSD